MTMTMNHIRYIKKMAAVKQRIIRQYKQMQHGSD